MDDHVLIARASSSAELRIPWSQGFPFAIAGTSAVVEESDYDEFATFAQRHYPDIYGLSSSDDRFLWTHPSSRRDEFYREHGDFFRFVTGGETVGVFLGNTQDWSTYCLRSAGILTVHQGKGLWQSFLWQLFKVLKAVGFERVEMPVSPANHRQIHVINKMGFIISGFQATERWGNVVTFTKFLSSRHSEVFYRQFCLEGPSAQA